MQRDPNRYAEGLEAAALRERIEDEELALDVLRTSYERAQQAHAETEAQFHDAEQQYLLYKGLLEDSSKYLGKARSRYVAQAASVALQRVLLHPVCKTPLEILAYIFELCIGDVPCDDQLPVDDDDIRNRQQQPFHLAAVCRRWLMPGQPGVVLNHADVLAIIANFLDTAEIKYLSLVSRDLRAISYPCLYRHIYVETLPDLLCVANRVLQSLAQRDSQLRVLRVLRVSCIPHWSFPSLVGILPSLTQLQSRDISEKFVSLAEVS